MGGFLLTLWLIIRDMVGRLVFAVLVGVSTETHAEIALGCSLVLGWGPLLSWRVSSFRLVRVWVEWTGFEGGVRVRGRIAVSFGTRRA
ncbi:hypothetical protein OIU85_017815, partial [Salix viminalis]